MAVRQNGADAADPILFGRLAVRRPYLDGEAALKVVAAEQGIALRPIGDGWPACERAAPPDSDTSGARILAWAVLRRTSWFLAEGLALTALLTSTSSRMVMSGHKTILLSESSQCRVRPVRRGWAQDTAYLSSAAGALAHRGDVWHAQQALSPPDPSLEAQPGRRRGRHQHRQLRSSATCLSPHSGPSSVFKQALKPIDSRIT